MRLEFSGDGKDITHVGGTVSVARRLLVYSLMGSMLMFQGNHISRREMIRLPAIGTLHLHLHLCLYRSACLLGTIGGFLYTPDCSSVIVGIVVV